VSEGRIKPGDVLMDKYRVDRTLGRGAMGEVVAATHVDLGHRVAIKLMLPSADNGDLRARFLREARASVHLKTQHVARVLDVGRTPDGAPYMIMEYLDGRDLGAELKARRPLPISEAVEYVIQACEGIAEAHAAGIVHRDIKPSNLFLTADTDGSPCVKVLDFGISKVADDAAALTGDLSLGSPLYMSPEQMRSSKDVDARADVWSLGVTLYELVAGKSPFHGGGIPEVCTRVFTEPPRPLATYRSDVPAGFEAVVAQCLEKERARRFPSVAALAAALVPYGPPRAAQLAERVAAVLGERVAPARPTDVLPPEPAKTATTAATGTAVVTTTQAPVSIPMRSRRGLAAAAVVALGAVAMTAALTFGRSGKPPVAPGAAQPPTSATSASVLPPQPPAASPDVTADAGAPAEPPPATTASATATAVASSAPPSAKRPRAPAKPAPAAPAAAQPAPVQPKPSNTIYDQ
jgi:serine/threonine-protein kinase